jgi:hypothetical protein
MPSNFPTSLDTFPAAATLAGHNLATDPHSTLHGNLGDALAAVEVKIGIDTSAAATTLDYLLKNPASIDPGHKHTGASLSGIVSSFNTRSGAVVATTGDYTAAQVTNAADKTAANTFTVSPQTITIDADAHKGLVITAHSATQSANLQEWQSSTPAALLSVSAGGILVSALTNNPVFSFANSAGAVYGQIQSLNYSTPTWALGSSSTATTITNVAFQWNSLNLCGLGILAASPYCVLQVGPKNNSYTTTTFKVADSYMHLGAGESSVGSVKVISFGFCGVSAHTYYPAFIGFQEQANVSWGAGDLIFGTHAQDADVTAVVVMRIDRYGLLSTKPTDAATATITTALQVGHASTGTPGTGFGLGVLLVLNSSTTADRPAAEVNALWATATDLSRKGRLLLGAHDAATSAGGPREGLRIESDGSNPLIGFLGAGAVARPTITGSRGGNVALASLLTALASLGLITDSTTA